MSPFTERKATFEELSNKETAAVLGLQQAAASNR
jgi:hypothetical protein